MNLKTAMLHLDNVGIGEKHYLEVIYLISLIVYLPICRFFYYFY